MYLSVIMFVNVLKCSQFLPDETFMTNSAIAFSTTSRQCAPLTCGVCVKICFNRSSEHFGDQKSAGRIIR